MAGRLDGRTALITGAGRGIGAAIARAFARAGARVLVTDIDEPAARTVAQAIDGSAEAARLDVRREADWTALLERLDAAGDRLAILVNNAGITGLEAGAGVPHDPEHARLADWRAVMETNLDGVFLGCRAALKAMRKSGGGSIVNIASRSGIVGVPGAAAYAASKAAVINHSRTVALYAAEQGLAIRCNAILPAAILTEMWEPLLGTGPERDARMAEAVADSPLRRFGTVEEVAALALLLASGEVDYMTGTALHLDGGLLAGSASPPPPR
jgi:NAD(P)-dependent dehydrogenase (short-subunit alcohol dehydrogenase family)